MKRMFLFGLAVFLSVTSVSSAWYPCRHPDHWDNGCGCEHPRRRVMNVLRFESRGYYHRPCQPRIDVAALRAARRRVVYGKAPPEVACIHQYYVNCQHCAKLAAGYSSEGGEDSRYEGVARRDYDVPETPPTPPLPRPSHFLPPEPGPQKLGKVHIQLVRVYEVSEAQQKRLEFWQVKWLGDKSEELLASDDSQAVPIKPGSPSDQSAKVERKLIDEYYQLHHPETGDEWRWYEDAKKREEETVDLPNGRQIRRLEKVKGKTLTGEKITVDFNEDESIDSIRVNGEKVYDDNP